MVPKLRQHDLKLLHSWCSEDTQPRANGGFYSTLCLLSTSNFCFDLRSFLVPRQNRLVFKINSPRVCRAAIVYSVHICGCVNPLALSKAAFFKRMTRRHEPGLHCCTANTRRDRRRGGQQLQGRDGRGRKKCELVSSSNRS